MSLLKINRLNGLIKKQYTYSYNIAAIKGIENWQNRLWALVKRFKIERDKMSSEKLKSKPTDPKYAKDDAYMFDSRNYFLKNVTFNIVDSQQLSIAISRMQGLTNR